MVDRQAVVEALEAIRVVLSDEQVDDLVYRLRRDEKHAKQAFSLAYRLRQYLLHYRGRVRSANLQAYASKYEDLGVMK